MLLVVDVRVVGVVVLVVVGVVLVGVSVVVVVEVGVVVVVVTVPVLLVVVVGNASGVVGTFNDLPLDFSANANRLDVSVIRLSNG